MQTDNHIHVLTIMEPSRNGNVPDVTGKKELRQGSQLVLKRVKETVQKGFCYYNNKTFMLLWKHWLKYIIRQKYHNFHRSPPPPRVNELLYCLIYVAVYVFDLQLVKVIQIALLYHHDYHRRLFNRSNFLWNSLKQLETVEFFKSNF